MSDRTWTLFVRLWKRVGRAAHEKREWSDDHLRELITRHPLPWHTDQDWTWEVIDARNATVKSGFMSSNAAQQYVEKAHEVARCRLTTAWSDYVAECKHLGKEP